MILQGGTGNGYAASVTSENMLTTLATTVSLERHTN